MTARLPAPLVRAGLTVFAHLPAAVRRRAVHAAAPCYTVGALLVMRDPSDRVLLVRQRHSHGWALPGGLLRPGETPEHGVAREVSEELSVAVNPAGLGEPLAVVDPDARRVDLAFTWRPEPDAAQPAVDGVEVIEAGWLPPTPCRPSRPRPRPCCAASASPPAPRDWRPVTGAP